MAAKIPATLIPGGRLRALNEDKVRTGDLGCKATTRELTQAILQRL